MVFENRKDSSLQMGKKGTISIRVPSAAQFATGQNTSVIRFLVTIPNVDHQQQALKQRKESSGQLSSPINLVSSPGELKPAQTQHTYTRIRLMKGRKKQ